MILIKSWILIVGMRFSYCVQLIFLYLETINFRGHCSVQCNVQRIYFSESIIQFRIGEDRIFLLGSKFSRINMYFSKLNVNWNCILLHMLCDQLVCSHVWHKTNIFYDLNLSHILSAVCFSSSLLPIFKGTCLKIITHSLFQCRVKNP